MKQFCYPFIILLVLISCFNAKAYTVKNLKAHYRNGQVFLVWKNADAVNLQYNVYRSKTKITNTSQLTSSTYLGFVVDSSSKNYRLSTLDSKNIFYRWNIKGQPVPAGKGLYAVTCTENASYYYAVMVVDLSGNTEEKSILPGENSLANAMSETVMKPEPVLQDSILMTSGAWKYRFVQFCNNQETVLYPAMNSTGSYGFNLGLVKKNIAVNPALIVSYQGEDLAANTNVLFESQFDSCWILVVDDWLPIRYSDGRFGDNVYYCCYHEHFNIYSDQNPIPTNGIIKTYPQKRVMESIHWLRRNFGIDSARVYVRGTSHNGIAALFTSVIYPEEIAAAYVVVEPVSLSTQGDYVYQQMWGSDFTDLNTDVLNYKTGDTLSFNQLTSMKKMIDADDQRSLPLIFDIHGKNDKTIEWNDGKVSWLDSLNDNHYGGAWYWDQREHNGDGKDFSADETLPDFLRYHTTKSYPSFSNCSINQNPGNGKKNNGDQYGAYNGYLDFDDDITDENCEYDVTVRVKDFYVGGILDAEQYNSCTADIAFHRLQHFNLSNGMVVKWKNFDSTNSVIQSGSITSNGKLLLIPGVIIDKSGNKIQLKISGCSGRESLQNIPDNVVFIKTLNGYQATIFTEEEQDIMIRLIDIMGRTLFTKMISLSPGSNTIEIPPSSSQIALVQIKGENFSMVKKLAF